MGFKESLGSCAFCARSSSSLGSTNGRVARPLQAHRTRLSARRKTRVLASRMRAIVKHAWCHTIGKIVGKCLGRIRSIDGAIDPCARDFYNDARLGQKFRDNRAHNRGGLLGEIANLRLAAGKTGKNTFHTEKQLLLRISALACGTL